MKKTFFMIAFCFIFLGGIFAQTKKTPESILGITEATVLESLDTEEGIKKLQNALKTKLSIEEQLNIYSFLAKLQEQTAKYQDAQKNYSIASNLSASINASKTGNAVADFNLLLGAVRCALSCGDTSSADFILSTAFISCTDVKIISYVKLYAVWSWLCKADDATEVLQPIAVLDSVLQDPSAISIHPQSLLTLWYVTGKKTYAEKLQKDFPTSPECALVEGKISVMPAPFWYFVPASRPEAVAEAESAKKSQVNEKSETITENSKSEEIAVSSTSINTEESTKVVTQQLGFFSNKNYAQDLIGRLKAKGFNPKIKEEIRPSGTTYFAVYVEENLEGTMGDQLKKAGFECYPSY